MSVHCLARALWVARHDGLDHGVVFAINRLETLRYRLIIEFAQRANTELDRLDGGGVSGQEKRLPVARAIAR